LLHTDSHTYNMAEARVDMMDEMEAKDYRREKKEWRIQEKRLKEADARAAKANESADDTGDDSDGMEEMEDRGDDPEGRAGAGKAARAARNFVFTCYAVEHEMETPPRYPQLEGWEDLIGYMVYQLEVGAKSGREHFQGYVEFNKMMTIKMVHDLSGNWAGVWLGKRRGTQEEAMDYSTKDETRAQGHQPIEYGIRAKSGTKRSFEADMLKLKEEIKAGKDEADIAYDDAALFRSYRQFIGPLRTKVERMLVIDWLPWVIYIEGKAGTNKSRSVIQEEPDMHMWNADEEFWENYNGQEAILMDEFRDSDMKFKRLLGILSGQHTFKMKGAAAKRNSSKRIYITSSKPYDTMYQQGVKDEARAQLDRRVMHRWNTAEDDIVGQIRLLKEMPMKMKEKLPEPDMAKIKAKPMYVYDPDAKKQRTDAGTANTGQETGDYNAFAS
jgi:hypothetical protein